MRHVVRLLLRRLSQVFDCSLQNLVAAFDSTATSAQIGVPVNVTSVAASKNMQVCSARLIASSLRMSKIAASVFYTGAVPIISHAGGVVFRQSASGIEYLLIRARKPEQAWVFPKGHIEEGETSEQAAIREVLEEAGVRAATVSSLGLLPMGLHLAEMFLMTFESDDSAPERECMWLQFNAAKEKLTFEESQHLLTRADEVARNLP